MKDTEQSRKFSVNFCKEGAFQKIAVENPGEIWYNKENIMQILCELQIFICQHGQERKQ
jgi:hypothetical protein